MAAALQSLSTSALTVKAVRPCRRSKATVVKARLSRHLMPHLNSLQTMSILCAFLVVRQANAAALVGAS